MVCHCYRGRRYQQVFLTDLSVSPVEGEVDLLGKKPADLQTGIKISEDFKITGTLKYVSGYTEFSGNEAEQSGNYIALQFEPTPEDAEVTVEIVGGTSGPVTLHEDLLWVGRISNKTTQKVKATVKGKDKDKVVTYDLTGLTLQSQAARRKE